LWLVTTTGSVIGATSLLGCSSDDCQPIGDGHQWCGAAQTTVPITGADGAFSVPGRINGAEVELLIDTGATQSLVSSELLDVDDETWQRLDELCIGDSCLRNETVYARETPFSSSNEDEPQGLLGMSVLRHLSLRFHDGERLTIGLEPLDCDGQRVPFELSGAGSPLARVVIDDVTLEAVVLDTGATRSVLDQATVDQLDPYVTDAATATSTCTVDGCSDDGGHLSTIDRVCVGAVCTESVEVKYPLWNAVGANWFARHDVGFDFSGEQLLFCDP
jgi:predicted aspartyl protease